MSKPVVINCWTWSLLKPVNADNNPLCARSLAQAQGFNRLQKSDSENHVKFCSAALYLLAFFQHAANSGASFSLYAEHSTWVQ